MQRHKKSESSIILGQVLIDSLMQRVSEGQESWRGTEVHEHQRSAYITPFCPFSSDVPQANSYAPKLCILPDPVQNLNESQLEDAARCALRLYSEDPSFGPPTVNRLMPVHSSPCLCCDSHFLTSFLAVDKSNSLC